MYYPLLRARQFELIALRELAANGAIQDCIMPVLEPVKETQSNLDLAYTVFKEHKLMTYLIVNPEVGVLSGDREVFVNYLVGLEGSVFLPAFYYNDNADYIKQSIDKNGLTNCMIICHSNVSADNEGFQTLLLMPEISAITVEDPERNRGLSRPLKKTGKTIIRLDDLFEKKERNSDYLSIPEHRFSEEHLYYKDEDFRGFSDYTVLPAEYSDSGSTPRAVVIHLTYLDELSIGTFHLKDEYSSVKIVDFTEETPLFQPTRINHTIKAKLLRERISADLSKPMRRYDSDVDYIPTQFICEFISVYTGAKGIQFQSSLHADGKNLVIFDQDLMQCEEVVLKKVNKLELQAALLI